MLAFFSLIVGAGSEFKVDTLPLRFTKPTAMVFSGSVLYVAEHDGKIWMVRNDTPRMLLKGLVPPVNSILPVGDSLLISHRGKVSIFFNGTLTEIVSGLPSFGACSNNGLALGPKGRIYLGQGEEDCFSLSHNLAGTIIRFKRDGSGLEVFSTGFHDPWGLAFQGDTLWVS
ncbi:MAG: hypothetical protein ACPL68_08240, partial [Candidatus Hydrothermia bacterium]